LVPDNAAVASDADAARITVERLVATASGTCFAAPTEFGGVLGFPDVGLVQKSAKKSASVTERDKRRAEADEEADTDGVGGNAAVDTTTEIGGASAPCVDDDDDTMDKDAGEGDTEGTAVNAKVVVESNGRVNDAVSCAQNESKNSDASCRLVLSVVEPASCILPLIETRVRDGCDGLEHSTETAAATGSEDGIEDSDRAIDAVSGAQNESKKKSSTSRAVVRRAAEAERGFNTALTT
jgi:hypothetical protein